MRDPRRRPIIRAVDPPHPPLRFDRSMTALASAPTAPVPVPPPAAARITVHAAPASRAGAHRERGRARRVRHVRDAGALLSVATGSLVLGGLTSYAQTVLPEPLLPAANSISGWTIVTALVVGTAAARRGWGMRGAAIAGPVAFVALTVGYALVSTARGWYYDPTAWGLVGLAAGPVVGAAVGALLSRRERIVAAGAGVLGGVLLLDSVRSMVEVAQYTGWTWWIVVGLAGIALLGGVLLTRLTSAAAAAIMLGVAAGVAAGGAAVLAVLSGAFLI